MFDVEEDTSFRKSFGKKKKQSELLSRSGTFTLWAAIEALIQGWWRNVQRSADVLRSKNIHKKMLPSSLQNGSQNIPSHLPSCVKFRFKHFSSIQGLPPSARWIKETIRIPLISAAFPPSTQRGSEKSHSWCQKFQRCDPSAHAAAALLERQRDWLFWCAHQIW